MRGLDPPFTDTEYAIWERTATRPYTQAPIGAHSAPLRNRCARQSAKFSAERYGKMIRVEGRKTVLLASKSNTSS